MCHVGYWNIEDIELIKNKNYAKEEDCGLELITHQEKPLYLKK